MLRVLECNGSSTATYSKFTCRPELALDDESNVLVDVPRRKSYGWWPA